MKFERLGNVIDLYKFSLGSMTYCVDRLRETLEDLGNGEAVAIADRARTKLERARQLEYDWEKQKQEDPLRREGARQLDDRIDRALSQIASTADTFAAMKTDTDVSRLADELASDLFPTGVFHITSKTFEDQHVAVTELIDRLESSYSEHIQALNLTPLVEQLKDWNKAFGEKLEPRNDKVDYDEVESARVEAEDVFHLLFARVMGDYGDDIEKFNRIVAPIHEQTEWTRRHHQRRGTIPEVDPETGEPIEPVDETTEGETPQNDGGSPEGQGDDNSPDTDSENSTETENTTDTETSDSDGETETDTDTDEES